MRPGVRRAGLPRLSGGAGAALRRRLVIDPRYQALLLLAVFGSLRWGELAALRRTDVDLGAHTVRVFRQLAELRGGFGFAPPKSDAGKRVVVIPAAIMPIVREHVERMGDVGDERLIFTSPGGAPLRHPNFRQRVWVPALRAAGLPADPLSRSASYRKHARGGHGRRAARADGADGPLHDPGGSHLPASQ